MSAPCILSQLAAVWRRSWRRKSASPHPATRAQEGQRHILRRDVHRRRETRGRSEHPAAGHPAPGKRAGSDRPHGHPRSWSAAAGYARRGDRRPATAAPAASPRRIPVETSRPTIGRNQAGQASSTDVQLSGLEVADAAGRYLRPLYKETGPPVSTGPCDQVCSGAEETARRGYPDPLFVSGTLVAELRVPAGCCSFARPAGEVYGSHAP